VALLHKPANRYSTLPHAPPLQKTLQICPLPGQGCYLTWWLTNILADNLDIFNMYSEMGNDERTDMQLTFQHSSNPSVFVTTPTVGGTGVNLTAEKHVVIAQKFRVLNDHWQAFAPIL
jgi:hypothetical protein